MKENDFMKILKAGADCELTCRELYKALDGLSQNAIKGAEAGKKLKEVLKNLKRDKNE